MSRADTTTHERVLEWALNYRGCRGNRPLTRTAIARADRAMRAVLYELARQSNCSVDELDIDDWYEGAGNCGDSEVCRALEWYWQKPSRIG